MMTDLFPHAYQAPGSRLHAHTHTLLLPPCSPKAAANSQHLTPGAKHSHHTKLQPSEQTSPHATITVNTLLNLTSSPVHVPHTAPTPPTGCQPPQSGSSVDSQRARCVVHAYTPTPCACSAHASHWVHTRATHQAHSPLAVGGPLLQNTALTYSPHKQNNLQHI